MCTGDSLCTLLLVSKQAALKKYQVEHKSKGESLEKCQGELKKLRRKSQGSKNPSKYGEKEMQVRAGLLPPPAAFMFLSIFILCEMVQTAFDYQNRCVENVCLPGRWILKVWGDAGLEVFDVLMIYRSHTQGFHRHKFSKNFNIHRGFREKSRENKCITETTGSRCKLQTLFYMMSFTL